MSDDLRTRIADVMVAHARIECIDLSNLGDLRCKCGQWVHVTHPEDPDASAAVWADHVADAVIRELETHYKLVPKSELYQELFERNPVAFIDYDPGIRAPPPSQSFQHT